MLIMLFFDRIIDLLHLKNNKRFKKLGKTMKVKLIKLFLQNLVYVADYFDFNKSIIIDESRNIFVKSEGVALNIEGTNRYFKNSSNEGKELLDFLKNRGIKQVDYMVDVGANFGEISLYFSKHFPKAKILAIEPSTANFQILQKNIKVQTFDTDNVMLEKVAISEKPGTINLTTGLFSENTIVLKKQNPTHVKNMKVESVKADTLENILEKHEINEIDFIKIDIEVAEPLMLPSIQKYSNRIKSIFIEFGRKINYEEYIPFINILCSSGFQAWIDENIKFESAEKAREYYINFKRKNNNKTTNFWFIKNDTD